jgi:hypothetical protein
MLIRKPCTCGANSGYGLIHLYFAKIINSLAVRGLPTIRAWTPCGKPAQSNIGVTGIRAKVGCTRQRIARRSVERKCHFRQQSRRLLRRLARKRHRQNRRSANAEVDGRARQMAE